MVEEMTKFEIEQLKIIITLSKEVNEVTLENVKLRSICGDYGIDISHLDNPFDIYAAKKGEL